MAGAYHSPLMASATRAMRPLLEAAKISAPRVPFFGNWAGAAVDDPEAIREGLIRQIESPVRWHQAMVAMAGTGVRRALEVGPGKVLQGLMRNIDASVGVQPAGTLEALEAACGLAG